MASGSALLIPQVWLKQTSVRMTPTAHQNSVRVTGMPSDSRLLFRSMPNEANRMSWPFKVPPLERETEEIKAKVAFLQDAQHHGFRSYVDQDDCGAVAPDGRESLIVWRGKQRAELLLIDAGSVTEKKLFANLSEAVAFRQASVEALAWLLHRRS